MKISHRSLSSWCRGSFAVAMLLVALMAAIPAYAADDQAPQSQTIGGFTVEPGKLYSRKEAYRVSTGRIVFHYGEGIWGLGPAVDVMNEDGYPTVALPGGPKGYVQLFVDRGIYGKYDQKRAIMDMGGNAQMFYQERVGPPNPPSSR